MSALLDLPSGVFCIAVAHSLDDPEVINEYLKYYPLRTRKCLPLAIRDILSPAAEALGFPPMKIPSAKDTMNILRILWNLDGTDAYAYIRTAIREGLVYLLPYFLSPNTFHHGLPSAHLLSCANTVTAAMSGDIDLVRMLIALGISGMQRDNMLYSVTEQKNCNPEIVQLLLIPTGTMRGADVNGRSGAPLRNAAGHACIDVVKLLIVHKANINPGAENYSPLNMAASFGRDDVVLLLLDEKANLHADGEAALKAAIDDENPSTVKILIEAKADANYEDVLPMAVGHGMVETIKLLLEHRADVHRDGEMAIRSAHTIPAIITLLDARADINAIRPEDLLYRTPEVRAFLESRGVG